MVLGRKEFLQWLGASALVGASGCATTIVPPRRIAANSKVQVALLGTGVQGVSNLRGFLADERCRVVVACDPITECNLYGYNGNGPGGRNYAKRLIDEAYGDHACRAVEDWREVIDDPTIDAVVIATPDHWHTLIAIAAMRKGKHVFCQKPLTISIEEGEVLARVAQECKVAFQVGSQSRSNPSFRVVCDIVHNHIAGDCRFAEVLLPGGNKGLWNHTTSTTPTALPKWFTPAMWDLWQGPAQHWANNAYIPGIHEPMMWRFNDRYGSGNIPDHGAHQIDQLQCGLRMDDAGPVLIENAQTDWERHPIWSWAAHFQFDLVYSNGFRAHVRHARKGDYVGVVWHTEKGEMFYGNGPFRLPACLSKFNARKDFPADAQRVYAPHDNHNHESDFIDMVLEGRQDGAAPIKAGLHTINICHALNICERLQLPSLRYDPITASFPDNPEANRMRHVEYHNGWKLA